MDKRALWKRSIASIIMLFLLFGFTVLLAAFLEDPEKVPLADALVPVWVLLAMLAIGALRRTDN